MGCDIHLHVEIKINNKWEHYSVIYMPRNYDIFARMANVRNEDGIISPISLPKGLPNDLSLITKIDADSWKCDMHSSSWLNIEEIKIIEKELETKFIPQHQFYIEHWYNIIGYLFGNSYGYLHEYKNDYPLEIEDVRWVFWFDN